MPSRPPDSLLIRSLCASGDQDPGLPLKLALVEDRRRLSREESQRMDRLMITELTARSKQVADLEAAHAQLTEAQSELKGLVEKLLAPPLREAVFCAKVVVGGEELAAVDSEQGRRLVRPVDESSLDSFVPGDLVYIAQGGNALVARADDRAGSGEVATVERVAGRDRLVLQRHGENVVVLRSASIRDAAIGAGDDVIWEPSIRLAHEVLPPASESPWILRAIEDAPRGILAGFGGDRDRVLSRFVNTVAHADIADRYGVRGSRSLLLYGPPGCGKTTMMRVIASELSRAAGESCRVAIVNGAELEHELVGRTQRNIRQLFRELAACPGPKLLYLDEVDAIGRARGGAGSQHSDRFLSSWLTELDGLRRIEDLAIVAATNRRDLIDPALLERLSSMELRVSRPTMAAAREIFRVHLPDSIPVSPNGAAAPASRTALIDLAVTRLYAPNADNQLARLRFRDGRERTVSARDLMSGRVCRQICMAARATAFEREVSGGPEGVAAEDIEHAVSDAIVRMTTLLTPRNVRSYLDDIPGDADVVAVDAVKRKVRQERYLAPTASTTGVRG
jgi:ATP-dependent 26S proteasome regulatory subunit